MTWNDVFWLLQGEPAAQASLLSLAWNEAALSQDAALLSNLHCNALNPNGVCMALDAASLRVPPDALPGPYDEAPFVRRFFVSLFSLLLVCGSGFFGCKAFYDKRPILGSALVCGGVLCGLAGFGLLLATAYPATWDWWL